MVGNAFLVVTAQPIANRGIDVRAYAQKGQNIVRASCVGCGICAAVCPRGVLKLENGSEENRHELPPIIIGNDSFKVSD